MTEPTVRMSGIVLASLMFQHVNSDSDVEGLVLGESRFEEQVTISDSQPDHIHIEEIYRQYIYPPQVLLHKYCNDVQKHVACHRLNSVYFRCRVLRCVRFRLYSSGGQVNMEAVQKMLADSKQGSVIGWYRQRRNTEQQMTFREKTVHESLKSALSNPHVIFILLTPSTLTPPGSTHRTEYAAFISRSRRFVNIPVLVNNLGLLEQQAYWKVSAPCSAAGYGLTMKKHGSRFFSADGLQREVTEVNLMNDSLQAELQVREASPGRSVTSRRLRSPSRFTRLFFVVVVVFFAHRKRAETWRRASVGWRRCGPTFRRSGADSVRSGGARQEKGHWGVEPIPADFKLRRGTPGLVVSTLDNEAVSAPEQTNNLLLHEALRTLFGRSPLLCTQTLTLQALPVPGRDISATTQASSDASSSTNCRKRLREAPPGRERKRRRSRC
ncbi:BRCA1-A complex subunit Abraxas 1 isoform X1 [Brachyistius frenatus]|uniref:BRCA1-A complex subunit Abraxas 1 isoform X1 n=1 Tax=Brachyistius frenatus TaxID=100188 RepID=UPI0037E90E12